MCEKRSEDTRLEIFGLYFDSSEEHQQRYERYRSHKVIEFNEEEGADPKMPYIYVYTYTNTGFGSTEYVGQSLYEVDIYTDKPKCLYGLSVNVEDAMNSEINTWVVKHRFDKVMYHRQFIDETMQKLTDILENKTEKNEDKRSTSRQKV